MAGFTATGDKLESVEIVKDTGAASFAPGQVSVAVTATQIVAARATRRSVLIVQHGTTAVYVGGSGVTTSNGLLVVGAAGSRVGVPTAGAVYGIVGTGTQTVSYMEVYD